MAAVLHGCETWSLTLREDFTLRVFENRVLRGIFGPTRARKRGLRRLHTTKQEALCFVLLTKYYLGCLMKKYEMGRACSMYGGEERWIQGFSRKT